MVRWLSISLAAIVGLVAALLAGLWVLLKTPYGAGLVDDISRPIVANIVRDQLGADITYAPVIGPLPGQLVLQDLALSTDGEVWFESESIIVAWNPWALLRGDLRIERVIVDRSALRRLPALPDRSDDPAAVEADEPREGDYLPFDVDLQELIIDDFTLGSNILGTEQTLSLQAQARVLKPRLRLSLHAQTENGQDELFVTGDIDRRGTDLDLVLVSEADGAVALAAQTEDRLELRLRVAGDYDELEAELGAALGRYGMITGTAARLPEQNNALRTALTYQPGEILPDEAHELLGSRLRIVADIVERRRSVDIELQTLSGAFGALAGSVKGKWDDQRSLAADLEGALSEHVLDAFGAGQLGGGFDLQAQVDAIDDGFAYDGTLNAGALSLEIRSGLSTEDLLFGGEVAVTTPSIIGGPAVLEPLLAEGANLSAEARLTAAQILTVRGLSAQLGTSEGQRLFAEGVVEYDLQSPTVVSDLSLVAEAGVLALLLDGAQADGDLSMDINASGALDDLLLSVNGSVPGGAVRGDMVAPGTLRAELTGLPTHPTGTVSLTASDSYAFNVEVRTEDRLTAVDRLDVRFGALTLTGAGQYDQEISQGQATLNLDAGDRTRLITGQVVSGQLTADMSNEAGTGLVRIAVMADDLRLDDNAVGVLQVAASGPPEAVAFDVTASDIAVADLFVHGITSSGTLSVAEAREAAIDAFVVRLSDDSRDPQEISLVRPTTARWGDGISLASTRLSWLNDGIVTASAEISQTSWIAQLAAQRIAVPGTDTFISLQLNLDTNDTDPASFQVVAATEGRDDRYAIRADGRWTGREVLTEGIIIRSGRERLGSFDVAAPLNLIRTPALAVGVPDAPIAASLDYDDTFAPLLAFLPIRGEPVAGRLQATADIAGPLEAPAISGEITIAETRIEDPEVGITLVDLAGSIAFGGQGSTLVASIDLAGSGRERREKAVQLSGTIDTTPDDPSFNLRFVADRAQLARNAELEVRLTSDLVLAGTFEEATLSGPITIDEFDFAIPDTQAGEEAPTFVPVNIVRTDVPENGSTSPIEDPAEAPPLILNLNMTVDARNGVFIRGRGLESEWSIDLDVQGTADDPKLRGTINSVDGTLDLAGRSFALTEGLVSFTPESGLDPTLDVQAETVTGTSPDQITAIATVTGPSSQPTITFTSNPALPEEDVLALILFGRPANQLGAAEALQLAQAAATLSGTGPFGGAGLANGLRSGLGLDRLSYDPEGNSLTVGKYIAEGVYVSAVQGIGELGTAFSVVYEVSRFFSLETTLKSNGAQALSGNYKRDY